MQRAGLPRAGGRARTDSTHVIACIRDLNRLEFVTETMRCALQALAVAAPAWPAGTDAVNADWLARYQQRADSYRLPKDEAERTAFAENVGGDGYELLDTPDVALQLGDPCAGRVGSDTQDVHAPGGDLHDEEDIETSEEDGLHVHEIASEQRVGPGSEEGAPGLLGGALRCGWQAGAAQNAPDRGGGDPMAKPSKFTLDSDVSPGRILFRQALDERDVRQMAGAGRKRRAQHGQPMKAAAARPVDAAQQPHAEAQGSRRCTRRPTGPH